MLLRLCSCICDDFLCRFPHDTMLWLLIFLGIDNQQFSSGRRVESINFGSSEGEWSGEQIINITLTRRGTRSIVSLHIMSDSFLFVFNNPLGLTKGLPQLSTKVFSDLITTPSMKILNSLFMSKHFSSFPSTAWLTAPALNGNLVRATHCFIVLGTSELIFALNLLTLGCSLACQGACFIVHDVRNEWCILRVAWVEEWRFRNILRLGEQRLRLEFMDLWVIFDLSSQKSNSTTEVISQPQTMSSRKTPIKNTARSTDNVGEANKIDKTPTYP